MDSRKYPWLISLDLRPLTLCLLFVIVKLALLDYRFGDGNAYLYDSYLLSKGGIPYKDFVLADFPVQIFLLTLIRPLFANWTMGFYMVPVVAEAITAYLIYLILHRRNNRFAVLAPLIHLWSFTVLSTSDFITGVQLTTMFTTFAWYLVTVGKNLTAGIAFALSFLTKLYALPAAAFFGIFDLLQKRIRPALWLLLGVSITMVLILAPILVVAPAQLFEQTLMMHFDRPAGLNKLDVLLFFVTKEWALLVASIPGFLFLRKNALSWSFLITIIFFLAFKDLYFVYLDYLLPFLVIFSLTAVHVMWELGRKMRFACIAVFSAMLANSLMSNYLYFTHFQKLGHFSNAEEVASAINKLPENYEIYGSHEVAPLVALLSGRSTFHNHSDTNTQLFAAGLLDREQISEAAVHNGVYLIARITHLPEQGYNDVGYEGYFSPDRMKDSCQRALTFPSTSHESDNQIVVYRCHKQI